MDPKAAEGLVTEFEQAILSLDEMPYRGSLRKHGRYANQGYRQIFVKNFTIVYRIEEEAKEVMIVAVHYSPRNI